MGGCAAISIDDNLAPGQPRITIGPANFKRACGIDMPFGFVRKHPVGQHISNRASDVALKLSLLLAAVITFGMLGRDNNGSASNRLAILIAQRDLTLAVRLKKRRSARVSVSSQTLQNLVAEIQRCRHKIGRLISGIAEHDALIARAFILVAAGINPLRDL